MGWVVNATPRPLYPRESPCAHCIGGWVGLRAGLDGCGKSRPHRNLTPRMSSPLIKLTKHHETPHWAVFKASWHIFSLKPLSHDSCFWQMCQYLCSVHGTTPIFVILYPRLVCLANIGARELLLDISLVTVMPNPRLVYLTTGRTEWYWMPTHTHARARARAPARARTHTRVTCLLVKYKWLMGTQQRSTL